MKRAKIFLAILSIVLSIIGILYLGLVLHYQFKPSVIKIFGFEFDIVTPTQIITPSLPLENPTFPILQTPTQVPPVNQPTSILAPTQEIIQTTFEVYANLSWQDTGVQINQGDILRIVWDGKSKWRGVSYGDYSDPLGGYIDNSRPEYDCDPLMPVVQAGWNALVSKIGETGVPTNPFKELPSGVGILFLAMNDCDKQRYDNDGGISVIIEIRKTNQ